MALGVAGAVGAPWADRRHRLRVRDRAPGVAGAAPRRALVAPLDPPGAAPRRGGGGAGAVLRAGGAPAERDAAAQPRGGARRRLGVDAAAREPRRAVARRA